jgi:hypothetical protein
VKGDQRGIEILVLKLRDGAGSDQRSPFPTRSASVAGAAAEPAPENQERDFVRKDGRGKKQEGAGQNERRFTHNILHNRNYMRTFVKLSGA